ncbi:unnamed protein product [Parascedosporium putredinis]|uniref:NAD(P)-binding protein n=1 Tax=Parascedosporium putredinis TaxID=1442378 RepID=A0A9P1GUZ0_9PEZI|nr:unnamed protein product [Parascedosporium putredinis]CAI7987855.1 unnamed protein product [Parascedosporium putredinis]
MFWGKSVSFTPKTDIPSLEGKVILVTGGGNGIGKQCILEFARHSPSRIWLAARNLEKAREAVGDIQKEVPDAAIEVVELDLTSLESVKAAAARVLAESDRLDVLLLNAGVMAIPAAVTKDGYEVQFGTNHVGHALLTKLLVPLLDKTAKGPGSDFDSLKTTGEEMFTYARYGQSKLANILFIRQLAKEYPQFTAAAVHPGVVNTNLFHAATDTPAILRIFLPLTSYVLTTIETGAKNSLWASVAEGVKSGEYYEPVGIPGKASAYGKNDELAKSSEKPTVHEPIVRKLHVRVKKTPYVKDSLIGQSTFITLSDAPESKPCRGLWVIPTSSR